MESATGPVPFGPLSVETVGTVESSSGLGKAYSAVRKRAYDSFCSLPFPSASHESWRQTKPEQFPFERLDQIGPVRLSLLDFVKHDPVSSTEVSFSPTFDGEEKILEELFTLRAPDLQGDAIAHLQLALASSGGILRVKGGRTVTAPVLLSQMLPDNAVGAPLVVIEIQSGASITIVEDLRLAGSSFYLPRVEILVRDNASCAFVSLQRSGDEACYLARHRVHLGRDARVRTTNIALGARVARVDLDCRLYEPGASAELDSLYLASGSRHIDFHSVQDHLAPHCGSNLYCKGALKDSARGVYYGLIRVAENAQKTDAYQKNRNLVLSPDARADAIPNLEIRANDVRCSHGASVGQVGAEELFYLMTRGLPEAEAERILVEGFFEDLLARETDQSLQTYIRNHILERLHARV